MGWRRSVAQWGLAAADAVAFTDRAQALPFLDAGVLGSEHRIFEVIEGSTRFTPGDLATARAASGVTGDPCLVWVGRLDANKDPLTVLDAVSRACDSLPSLRLWCCHAEAPLLSAVQQRIDGDPRLAERVRLLGRLERPAVQDLLRAADFLLLGSHREGSGYAVIEALACGATPLVTDIPSFRRITDGGRVGALSPVGDAEAMARAIVDWASRDRATLRKNARDQFERALSFDAIGMELRQVYEALVARQ